MKAISAGFFTLSVAKGLIYVSHAYRFSKFPRPARAGECARPICPSALPVAPHAGSDRKRRTAASGCRYFNPRSPWGERQQRCTNLIAYLWRRGRIFACLAGRQHHFGAAWGANNRQFAPKSGANLPPFSACYGFAVRESGCPPADRCSCSRSAPPSFHTDCPGSKSAGSPAPCS